MAIKLTKPQILVLAFPLLMDTLITILTLGWWSPQTYRAAYESEWMKDWVYERRWKMRRMNLPPGL